MNTLLNSLTKFLAQNFGKEVENGLRLAFLYVDMGKEHI